MELLHDEKSGRLICRSEDLEVHIETARGMDISRASFQGVDIGWLRPSALGPVTTGYDDQIQESSMFFGLLSTCGLENAGPSCQDGELFFCRHGSINWNSAEKLSCYREGDALIIKGTVPSLRFVSPLLLHREIGIDPSRNAITLRDRVENRGSEKEQLCLMYHYNFGAPFLSPGCRVSVPRSHVRPKNEAAERAMDKMYELSFPDENAQPVVYYHEYEDKVAQIQKSSIENPQLGIRVELGCATKGLPMLDLWKDMRPGRCVLSLEPCNMFPYGRTRQREQGIARYVPPGDTEEFETEIVFMRI